MLNHNIYNKYHYCFNTLFYFPLFVSRESFSRQKNKETCYTNPTQSGIKEALTGKCFTYMCLFLRFSQNITTKYKRTKVSSVGF